MQSAACSVAGLTRSVRTACRAEHASCHQSTALIPHLHSLSSSWNIRFYFRAQLLMVLPPASHELLPKALWSLVLSDASPIHDFFPTDFQTDGEGKRADYEAVVLLPFVDKKRLIEAFKLVEKESYREEEVARNIVGDIHVFERQVDSKETDDCKSTLKEYAGDVLQSESRCVCKTPVPALAPGQAGFEPVIVKVCRVLTPSAVSLLQGWPPSSLGLSGGGMLCTTRA
jgi:5'-3' exonuclease